MPSDADVNAHHYSLRTRVQEVGNNQQYWHRCWLLNKPKDGDMAGVFLKWRTLIQDRVLRYRRVFETMFMIPVDGLSNERRGGSLCTTACYCRIKLLWLRRVCVAQYFYFSNSIIIRSKQKFFKSHLFPACWGLIKPQGEEIPIPFVKNCSLEFIKTP